MTANEESGSLPTDWQVVVTGASSGIGRAIAVRLATAGASRVVVHYRGNRAGATETGQRVRAAGATPLLLQADLGSDDDRRRLHDQAWQQLGRVDVWVHNAGVDVLTGAAAGGSFEDKLQALWQVDVHGTICLARSVADAMLQQPERDTPASMLFIGWDQALYGMEGDAGQMFGPVKAAVMAFSVNLAQTLAPRVRVNCIAPGWIRTAWGATASQAWQQRAVQQSLMGTWGTPRDVAEAAAYLSSPAARFITGQILNVNGGWNRRPACSM